MCQIDMPTQRNDNIHKSVTEFPFKPFGLAIHHLALSIISRLLSITGWLGAFMLYLTDFLARCFPVRFCQ